MRRIAILVAVIAIIAGLATAGYFVTTAFIAAAEASNNKRDKMIDEFIS